ncbi:MAG: hypothetical protein JNM33_12470 [Rubrivivax sp.]|nr:hypothetical protein [Rubrivivax sp.]
MSCHRFVAIALLGAAALAGCAQGPAPTTAMLTYVTSPEGATLYEGGKSLGVAPVTRTYSAEAGSNSIRTPEVTAIWPSGAKETFYTFVPVGADRVATIERPPKAPGLQADLDHAKKVAATREQDEARRKEDLARDQARASGRCKAQQAGGSLAVSDDCK